MELKPLLDIIVGIATIISCIATIIGLFMVKEIINNTTTVIDEQATYNSRNNQLINFFYNIGAPKIDTIVVNNKDTAFIQTPTSIKIIREDIEDTILMTLPPRRLTNEDLYFKNHRKEFAKFKEQQTKESTEPTRDEDNSPFDEAKFVSIWKKSLMNTRGNTNLIKTSIGFT